jgi:hypothetical protein
MLDTLPAKVTSCYHNTYFSLLASVSLLPYFTELKGIGSYVCDKFLRGQSEETFSG